MSVSHPVNPDSSAATAIVPYEGPKVDVDEDSYALAYAYACLLRFGKLTVSSKQLGNAIHQLHNISFWVVCVCHTYTCVQATSYTVAFAYLVKQSIHVVRRMVSRQSMLTYWAVVAKGDRQV